jgi:DNA-binding transcriptional LysR family regulator
MIETRVLKQFVTVAETLNFHRAAELLHMSQPPLSVAVRQLEEKLGVTLLIRDRGGVALTPAGSAFLHSARGLLHSLDQQISHVRKVAEGLAGKLTISSVSLAGYPRLLNALRQFRQRYPQVELEIKEMPSAMQIRAVQQGETDLAFIRQPAVELRHGKLTPFLTEKIVVALPAEHPLAAQREINLCALADQDFVFTPPQLGEGYYQQLIQLCQSAGFYPRIVQQAAQISTLIALVSCGFGLALVPESVANDSANAKVRFLPLSDATPQAEIALFMLFANTQPVAATLANFLALLDNP